MAGGQTGAAFPSAALWGCRRQRWQMASLSFPLLPHPTALQFYDLPAPSVRNAIYDLMRADVAPYKVGCAAD
jgi:hypothetical protein